MASAELFSQPENNPIVFQKDSLLLILNRFRFKKFYEAENIPPEFHRKKTRAYRVPQDEKIMAFIDASILGNCKFGIVVGVRGLYVNNSSTSLSRGTQYIPYSKLKEHDMIRIDQNEFKIDKTAIEVYGLGENEQSEFRELISMIKNNLPTKSKVLNK